MGLCFKQPFLYWKKTTTQNSKKAHCHASSNEPKHFLNKAMNNKPNEPRKFAIVIHISPSSIIALLLVCCLLAECTKH